jgi:hypothetical protein
MLFAHRLTECDLLSNVYANVQSHFKARNAFLARKGHTNVLVPEHVYWGHHKLKGKHRRPFIRGCSTL